MKKDEMKTSKEVPCHHCRAAVSQRSAGRPTILRIRKLIGAACAARAGSGQMTLNDWLDVEQEVNRRLANQSRGA
jgi:hypothetical protein